MEIFDLVFGELLVEKEAIIPFALAHRRKYAHDRRPLHHRETGTGKAGYTAEYDHAKNGRAADQ